MAWLESHQELREHHKLKRMCASLDITKPQAVGHLHLLWWWVLQYRMDGVLTGLNDQDIANAAEWTGDPRAFVRALLGDARRPGFLDRRRGVLTLHDWLDYCGEVVRKRLQRLALKRQKSADIGGQNPPTQPKQPHPDQTKPTNPNDHTLPGGVREAVSLLEGVGVRKLKAVALFGQYPIERIRETCSRAQGKRNPAGYVISSLEKGY